jgi:hypothetical protein
LLKTTRTICLFATHQPSNNIKTRNSFKILMFRLSAFKKDYQWEIFRHVHQTRLATEIRVVLVLLPKNRRKNNIFQSFIALKTKIKPPKTCFRCARQASRPYY